MLPDLSSLEHAFATAMVLIGLIAGGGLIGVACMIGCVRVAELVSRVRAGLRDRRTVKYGERQLAVIDQLYGIPHEGEWLRWDDAGREEAI